MISDPEENRLNQSLRDKFEDFDLTPSAPVWAGIEQRLTPPPVLRARRRPVPLPWLLALVALLAGLTGWLLPHGSGRGPEPVATRATSPVLAQPQPVLTTNDVPGTTATRLAAAAPAARHPQAASGGLSQPAGHVASSTAISQSSYQKGKPRSAIYNSVSYASEKPAGTTVVLLPTPLVGTTENYPSALPAPAAAVENSPVMAMATAAETVPATLRPLAALERQTLAQLPSVFTLAPGTPATGNHAALIAHLRTERAELLRLQRRADSLLLALGDLPGAPLATPAVTAATPTDTTQPRPLTHRWSLQLVATPEQNTLTLQGPENNPLTALRRNHETGRAGLNAALLAEYQLAPRLSVGGGVGYSTFGADLRITNKTTDILVRYDTATAHTTNVYSSTNQTYSIRIVQAPQLSPIFNGSGQVIRYDTVYVPRQDTVFSTIVQHDTIRTTTNTITPNISKKETLTTKLLQPNYRFFTVPMLVRYRLGLGAGRWWADVAAGAQLQFFLGGTQVVTDDGETFRTQTVTAGNGPFRALNVALSGSLALNYALTNRLSVSVAPSMRWQALSVYKAETGLIQQPTATGLQLGVRFKL